MQRRWYEGLKSILQKVVGVHTWPSEFRTMAGPEENSYASRLAEQAQSKVQLFHVHAMTPYR